MTDAARDRRTEIIDAAATLFDRKGYHATNMGQIAAAVGMAKPTLYHYFSSKDDILYEIHDEFIGLLLSRHENRQRNAPRALVELLDLMSDMLDLMQTHHGHVRVFFEHHRDLSPARRGEVIAKRDRYLRIVESTIRRGIEQGDFRPVDVSLAALAVFGICNWTYQWFRPDGPLQPRDIAKTFWNLIVAGLAEQPNSPHERVTATLGS